MSRDRKKTSPESLFLLSKRKVMYSTKQDKDITAIASYYGVKVKTIRMIAINPDRNKIERITKIIKL